MSNTPTGFDGFGHPVPEQRLQKGYETAKILLWTAEQSEFSLKELSISIVRIFANAIERDQPFRLLGPSPREETIGKLDLTGRYRLLAVLLTD